MTRAPLLSAVAAALLLGLAAAAPAAADDAASSATPAAAAAAADGEFDDFCAMGLASGQTVKTDCSVTWTSD
ncbi:MAG: hypothetical protein WBE08_07375, partial [Methyloceanibacter sp.]